jgi:hypothetical protein
MAAPSISINAGGPVDSLRRDRPNSVLQCCGAAASECARVWVSTTGDSQVGTRAGKGIIVRGMIEPAAAYSTKRLRPKRGRSYTCAKDRLQRRRDTRCT